MREQTPIRQQGVEMLLANAELLLWNIIIIIIMSILDF